MKKQNISILEEALTQEVDNSEEYTLEGITDQLNALAISIYDDYFSIIFRNYHQLYHGIWKIYSQCFLQLKDKNELYADTLREEKIGMLHDINELLEEYKQLQWPIIGAYLEKGIANYIVTIDKLSEGCIEIDYRVWDEIILTRAEDDSPQTKRRKAVSRFGRALRMGNRQRKVYLKKIVKHYLSHLLLIQLDEYLHAAELVSEANMRKLGEILIQASEEWETLIKGESTKEDDTNLIENVWEKVNLTFQAFDGEIKEKQAELRTGLIELHQYFGQLLETASTKIDGAARLKQDSKEERKIRLQLQGRRKKWEANQILWHNELSSQMTLLTVRARLSQLTQVVKTELETTFFKNTDETIRQIREKIQKLSSKKDKLKKDEAVQDLFQIKDDLFVSDSQLIEDALAKAHDAIDDLPANVRLKTVGSDRRKLDNREIALASIVNYLTQTYFFAPLKDELQKLPQLFKRLYFRIQDATRLIAFNLQPENIGKRAAKQNLAEVLEKAGQDISLTYQELRLLLEKLEKHIDDRLVITLQHLSLPDIIDESEKLRGSIRSDTRLKGLKDVLGDYKIRVRDTLRKIMKLLGLKHARLLSRDWNDVQTDRNIHARLRNFVEKIKPQDQVLRALPFYYQQLFIGKEILITTVLKHRDAELAEAKSAAKRLMQGLGGGILVVGDPLAGKSYFCQHVATHCFPSEYYLIKPPLEGAIFAQDLTRAFQKSLKGPGSLSHLIESTPVQTVFILDNLELWWERSTNGGQVLKNIFELIEQYGRDYFFILNCNTYTFRLLEQLTDIKLHIASTIHLSPMDSQQIKAVLLDRHFSGANSLEWKGKSYEDLSARDINYLFRKYYSLSRGNVGMALRLWLGSIVKVSKDRISIREPLDIEMPQIEDTDWLLILSQFILHKRLTITKISRIYQGVDPEMLNSHLTSLLRAGLIEQVGRYAYQINPYLTLDIIRQLKEAQLL